MLWHAAALHVILNERRALTAPVHLCRHCCCSYENLPRAIQPVPPTMTAHFQTFFTALALLLALCAAPAEAGYVYTYKKYTNLSTCNTYCPGWCEGRATGLDAVLAPIPGCTRVVKYSCGPTGTCTCSHCRRGGGQCFSHRCP